MINGELREKKFFDNGLSDALVEFGLDDGVSILVDHDLLFDVCEVKTPVVDECVVRGDAGLLEAECGEHGTLRTTDGDEEVGVLLHEGLEVGLVLLAFILVLSDGHVTTNDLGSFCTGDSRVAIDADDVVIFVGQWNKLLLDDFFPEVLESLGVLNDSVGLGLLGGLSVSDAIDVSSLHNKQWLNTAWGANPGRLVKLVKCAENVIGIHKGIFNKIFLPYPLYQKFLNLQVLRVFA